MTDPTANILASFSSAIAALAAKATPSIVSVHSRRSRATGFVFKPGFVITADETLADEGEVQVRLADGTSRTSTVAGRDHTTDIALLRVDTAGLAPIKLSAGIPRARLARDGRCRRARYADLRARQYIADRPSLAQPARRRYRRAHRARCQPAAQA